MSANGRLDVARELVPISGTHLRPITAAAFVKMNAACEAATGRTLDIVNGAGGYRDWEAQVALYRNPPAGVKVAAPGSSTHGQGYALDLTTTCFVPAVRDWLRSNCSDYGFTKPPANDPRHFYHDGKTTGPRPVDPETPVPAPYTQEEINTMKLITATGNGGAFLQTENGVRGILALTRGTVERLQKTPPGESLLLHPYEIEDLDTVLRSIAAPPTPTATNVSIVASEEDVAAIAAAVVAQIQLPTGGTITLT